MPNWCENNVIIATELNEEDIRDKILNKYGKITKEWDNNILWEFDYDKVIPQPDNIKEALNNKDDSWYDWRIENWGVKWNAADEAIEISLDDGWIFFSYYTPWSEPKHIIDKLREDDNIEHITWKYDDPSMEYTGYA